jgi:hypothetical protein
LMGYWDSLIPDASLSAASQGEARILTGAP